MNRWIWIGTMLIVSGTSVAWGQNFTGIHSALNAPVQTVFASSANGAYESITETALPTRPALYPSPADVALSSPSTLCGPSYAFSPIQPVSVPYHVVRYPLVPVSTVAGYPVVAAPRTVTSVAAPRIDYRPTMPAVSVPRTYYLGRGILGQPKLYVPGQPLRNALRFLTF